MDSFSPVGCSRPRDNNSRRSFVTMSATNATTGKTSTSRLGGDCVHRQGLRLLRPRHPLVLGTAALSLLATALPSSAFAATTGNHPFGLLQRSAIAASSPALHQFARRPLFVRGGQSSMTSSSTVVKGMSGGGERTQAPPAPAVSPFSRPIKRVTVVGGTHGNEYTGVWCIKVIEQQREVHNQQSAGGKDSTTGTEDTINVFKRFPTLDIDTLLGNPVAHMENKRFVDVDLNREFSLEKLQRVRPTDDDAMEECEVRSEFCSVENDDALPHEAVRAREIEMLLGPKFVGGSEAEDTSCDDPNVCVVIDLHTTTANMGISLIVAEGDALMSAAAAYVLHKCRQKYGPDEAQCLMHALPQRRDRMNLSSCGRHGFTVEVGPTPQGVLRHDVVEKTEVAMHALMEFLHLRNLELEGEDGAASGGGDEDSSSPLLDLVEEWYPGGIVPCYRSAPAVRPGELSGKISWPNDPANPNFPALMVHKDLQDRDFHPLRVGDPLFVELDGTIVPYDGSHGEEVHLIFVNEGGYYYASSGTGIGVAVKSKFDFLTGWFVVESDDEGSTEEVVFEEKDSYE